MAYQTGIETYSLKIVGVVVLTIKTFHFSVTIDIFDK